MSSELEIEGYDLVRSDRSRRGGGVAYFVKNSISYNRKPNFCINTESIVIEIFLPKSKPVLTGILYRPPDKYNFVNCRERTFSGTNVLESQECYLLGDININLQPKDKGIFTHKPANTINKDVPHLTRSYLEFYFIHSLQQIITRPTRVTDQTAVLIDHILTDSPDKVSQSGVIDLGLFDHDLIYCTKKTSLPKFHKHNEIFVRSLKIYSAENFFEILREIVFPNYLTYTCVNDTYSDFIYRFVEAINFTAPSKKIRVKVNSKPWFDNQIVSAIQRRDKLCKKFKHSGLETDKDNFKVAKMHLQKMILKKKKSYFEEELGKNRNKRKELWKTLKSLGLSSDKARQSKVSLKKDSAIQFEALENANTFKKFYSELAGGLQEKFPRAPNKFTSQTTKNHFAKTSSNVSNNFEFSNVSEEDVKKILLYLDTSKAARMDQIPAKFLRDSAEVLALHWGNIVNLPIKLSTFPGECKFVKLKSIFKKAARTYPKNYRPISLLPLVSKIIEKSIHFQIEDYLNKKKLISMYQSGFRMNNSTDLCLTQLIDFVATGMNRQMHTGMILLDIQKAFDTLDHGFLLKKMKYFGSRASVMK